MITVVKPFILAQLFAISLILFHDIRGPPHRAGESERGARRPVNGKAFRNYQLLKRIPILSIFQEDLQVREFFMDKINHLLTTIDHHYHHYLWTKRRAIYNWLMSPIVLHPPTRASQHMLQLSLALHRWTWSGSVVCEVNDDRQVMLCWGSQTQEVKRTFLGN